MATHGVCKADGCGKAGKLRRGFCNAHYLRWTRHGSPHGGGPAKTEAGKPEEFYQSVVLNYSGTTCLIWPYARTGSGYSQMRVDGKNVSVQRRVCEAIHGPAPSAYHEAAHICGMGHEGCVSPRHLRWATGAENQADRLAHGTALLGSKHPRAKLTEADVRVIRSEAGDATNTQLAAAFGVTKQNIASILKGKTWGWLS